MHMCRVIKLVKRTAPANVLFHWIWGSWPLMKFWLAHLHHHFQGVYAVSSIHIRSTRCDYLALDQKLLEVKKLLFCIFAPVTLICIGPLGDEACILYLKTMEQAQLYWIMKGGLFALTCQGDNIYEASQTTIEVEAVTEMQQCTNAPSPYQKPRLFLPDWCPSYGEVETSRCLYPRNSSHITHIMGTGTSNGTDYGANRRLMMILTTYHFWGFSNQSWNYPISSLRISYQSCNFPLSSLNICPIDHQISKTTCLILHSPALCRTQTTDLLYCTPEVIEKISSVTTSFMPANWLSPFSCALVCQSRASELQQLAATTK